MMGDDQLLALMAAILYAAPHHQGGLWPDDYLANARRALEESREQLRDAYAGQTPEPRAVA